MSRRFNNHQVFHGQAYSRGNFGRSKVIKSFNPYELVNALPVSQTHEAYIAQNAFANFAIDPRLKTNIAQKGYVTPTPIQDQAIPPILAGQDIIGIANTGTGKTAAFLVPLLNKVMADRQQKVLIVAPTRELATQIQAEFMDFSRNLWLSCVLCIGGVNITPQKQALRRQFNFVVGTPGRLKDLSSENILQLSTFQTVVLDEADHMVDIGFLPDIKYLISRLPMVRQSLFFSATIDGKVKEIIGTFVKNPVTISVQTRETAVNVQQTIIKVQNPALKIQQLHDLLLQKNYAKVLIFGRTKHGVQKLADELQRRGFKAGAIHGNKSQGQRQRVLEKFKRHEITILLATDLASRGLDVPDISHVINYDMPESRDAYIHRIGRTGRADKLGTALTFV